MYMFMVDRTNYINNGGCNGVLWYINQRSHHWGAPILYTSSVFYSCRHGYSLTWKAFHVVAKTFAKHIPMSGFDQHFRSKTGIYLDFGYIT